METRGGGVVLGKWSQRIGGSVALALLVAGAVAVFRTENEVGSAGLLAAGTVVGLLSVWGRLPASIKFGNVEILLAEAAKAEDAGNVEVAEALLERARNTMRSYVRSDVPVDSLDASSYERAVLQALSSNLPTGARMATEALAGRGIVSAIVNQDERGVGIEVRAGTSFRPRDVLPRLETAAQSDVISVHAFLVVVQADKADPALEMLQTALDAQPCPVRVIGWRLGQPTRDIEAALAELLSAHD